MQTPITLEIVLAFLTVMGSIAAVWWVVDGKINQIRDDGRDEAAKLAAELAAYKLHVAETYMSRTTGGAAIDRNTVAVETMATALKAEIVRVETAVVGRIERMENRVFTSSGSPHKE